MFCNQSATIALPWNWIVVTAGLQQCRQRKISRHFRPTPKPWGSCNRAMGASFPWPCSGLGGRPPQPCCPSSWLVVPAHVLPGLFGDALRGLHPSPLQHERDPATQGRPWGFLPAVSHHRKSVVLPVTNGPPTALASDSLAFSAYANSIVWSLRKTTSQLNELYPLYWSTWIMCLAIMDNWRCSCIPQLAASTLHRLRNLSWCPSKPSPSITKYEMHHLVVRGPVKVQLTSFSTDFLDASFKLHSGFPRASISWGTIRWSSVAGFCKNEERSPPSMHSTNRFVPSASTCTAFEPFTAGAATPTTRSPYFTPPHDPAATQYSEPVDHWSADPPAPLSPPPPTAPSPRAALSASKTRRASLRRFATSAGVITGRG